MSSTASLAHNRLHLLHPLQLVLLLRCRRSRCLHKLVGGGVRRGGGCLLMRSSRRCLILLMLLLLVQMMVLLLLLLLLQLLLLLLELLLMKGALVGDLVDDIGDLVGLIGDELRRGLGRAGTPVSRGVTTTTSSCCHCALYTATAASAVRLYPEESLPG